jgi:hypothetical protein
VGSGGCVQNEDFVCSQPFGWQLQLGIASSLCFNRVFELAGVKYLSLPVPAAHGSSKNKAKAVLGAEAVPKNSRATKKRRRASSQAGDKTS